MPSQTKTFTVTNLSYTQLKERKTQLEGYLRMVEAQMDKFYDYQCDLCYEVELDKDLPKGWGYVVDYPATLCDVCIERWNERFDNLEVTREI